MREVTPPTRVVPWRLDIQGMRGLTMLAIVLFHAGLPIPGGFVSLDAFFVISGFVISGMLAREHIATGTLSLKRFYLRRFKRLTPALAVTLVIVVLTSALIVSPIETQVVTSQTALGATYLVANVVVQATTGGYFDLGAELNPLLHTWSLSLEEQFYLVFPTVLFAGWFLARRLSWPRSTAVVMVSVMGATSLALAVIPVPWLPSILQSEAVLGYYSPIVRTWEFAAGALLFFATRKLGLIPTWTGSLLGLLGLLFFLFPMWAIDETVRYPGPWTLVPVVGTLLLLLAGFSSRNLVTRALATRPMVYIGDRSYSWYLWHWPLIVFSLVLFPGRPRVALLAAVLSLGVALVSFRFVENPLRRRNMSNTSIAWLTLSLLGGSTLAAGVVLVGASNGWWSPTITQAQAQLQSKHRAQLTGCHTYEPLDKSAYDTCWLRIEDSAPIMVVGDSNADHFSEAALASGEVLGRSVSVTSASDCAFIAVRSKALSFVPSDRCSTYYGTTMTWLAKQPSGLVVIATSGAQFTTVEQLRDYTAGLTTTVATLENFGHDVMLVQPIPRVPLSASFGAAWDPRGCSMPTFLSRNCGVEWPLKDSAIAQESLWDANLEVASKTGAAVLDLSGDLCKDGICATDVNDFWVYQDFNHLTRDASRVLGDSFTAAVTRI